MIKRWPFARVRGASAESPTGGLVISETRFVLPGPAVRP